MPQPGGGAAIERRGRGAREDRGGRTAADWVKVTRKGRAALKRELQALNDLIADVERNASQPKSA